jgi:DNA-binding GntR family transcriptional regulator
MKVPDDVAKRRTRSEGVADRLRQAIISGEMPLGSRVRQQELAARFGVSTTPVREAFQMLQTEGLLQIDPHKGAIVRQPTEAEVREIYEMRMALEGLAIEKATTNMTETTLQDLQQMLRVMEMTGDGQTWASLNQSFHARIYQAAMRPRLSWSIDRLRDLCEVYVRMGGERYGFSRPNRDHRQIVNALERRNVSDARQAVEGHLALTLQLIIEIIEQSKELSKD